MVGAMAQELRLSAGYLVNEQSEKEIIDTVYFGGGTPSILDSAELSGLLQTVGACYRLSERAEITLEANPDDITTAKLRTWLDLGINRLSIGVQSFHGQDLQWMNRAHNDVQALASIGLAQKAGFDNYSVDLIYGTPGLSDERWKQHVNTVIGLGVPHLACYALTVEPKTALHKMIRLHKKTDIDSDRQAAQFLLLMQWLKAAGYEHYEISNFSLPGFRSRHNSSYWKGIKYVGIGPSAHSFDGKKRRWNISNNARYIQSLADRVVPFEEETLGPSALLNEYVMTALRTIEGIDLDLVEEKFSLTERTRITAAADGLVGRGMIDFNGRAMVLTDEGKLFADGIAADLFSVSG